jgi:hypothetical protein
MNVCVLSCAFCGFARKPDEAGAFEHSIEDIVGMVSAEVREVHIVDGHHPDWCPRTGGAAVMQINVSTSERWDRDYRIPDVSVMRPERVPAGEVLFVQPSVAIEVRSPGDETYETLAFYAAVGVEALMVVERDTRTVQVFVLSGGDLVVVPPLSDGWTPVAAIGIEARTTVLDHGPALHLRLSGEPATERAL